MSRPETLIAARLKPLANFFWIYIDRSKPSLLLLPTARNWPALFIASLKWWTVRCRPAEACHDPGPACLAQSPVPLAGQQRRFRGRRGWDRCPYGGIAGR